MASHTDYACKRSRCNLLRFYACLMQLMFSEYDFVGMWRFAMCMLCFLVCVLFFAMCMLFFLVRMMIIALAMGSATGGKGKKHGECKQHAGG